MKSGLGPEGNCAAYSLSPISTVLWFAAVGNRAARSVEGVGSRFRSRYRP